MNYKLKTSCGDTFHKVAERAKEMASTSGFKGDAVEFDFNGVVCIVNKDTNLEYLWRYYADAHLMEWKSVGPFCKEKYDKNTKEELDDRRLAQEKKEKAAQAAYEKKCAEQKAQVDAVTKGVTLLIHPDKQNDYETYVSKNSNDGYSRCVIDYAEQWAKLMQVEISKGRTVIAEIAEECQKSLGYLGITGFQYGCIVSALSHFWVFGEELRRWHNKEYGVNEDQKGVVNPALLTVGVK
jgi:hypothetical protein